MNKIKVGVEVKMQFINGGYNCPICFDNKTMYVHLASRVFHCVNGYHRFFYPDGGYMHVMVRILDLENKYAEKPVTRMLKRVVREILRNMR